MAAFEDRFFSAPDDLRLHYRDYDDAPTGSTPILCLAGLTRNARDFAELAGRLAAGRRIILAEQRGRGQSDYDPQPENYHPGIYVRDMMALIDHLELPRVIIIGTSLGGLMAMLMAAGFPERFAGILLNDIGPIIDARGLAKIQDYIDRVPMVKDWDAAARDLQTLFGSSFPNYRLLDWDRFARALYRENERGVPVLDYDPKIAVNVKSGGSASPDLWPVFDALPLIPTAVVRGQLSNILAADILAEMQRRRPDLMAVELPDIGHAPSLIEDDALRLIGNFLALIDQRETMR
jgi:pimeloyl-ACP methyl ester carboxylesterase